MCVNIKNTLAAMLVLFVMDSAFIVDAILTSLGIGIGMIVTKELYLDKICP
jgi:hypothetical protein